MANPDRCPECDGHGVIRGYVCDDCFGTGADVVTPKTFRSVLESMTTDELIELLRPKRGVLSVHQSGKLAWVQIKIPGHSVSDLSTGKTVRESCINSLCEKHAATRAVTR